MIGQDWRTKAAENREAGRVTDKSPVGVLTILKITALDHRATDRQRDGSCWRLDDTIDIRLWRIDKQ